MLMNNKFKVVAEEILRSLLDKEISCLRRHDFHFEKDIRILTIPEIVRFGARDLNGWRMFVLRNGTGYVIREVFEMEIMGTYQLNEEESRSIEAKSPR